VYEGSRRAVRASRTIAATAVIAGLTIPSTVVLVATRVPIYNLGAKGGTVRLAATVKNAKTCAWSSSPKVAGFDATVKCKTGKVARSVKLKANTSTKSKSYAIRLTVRGKSTTVDQWKVDEAGKTTPTEPTTTTTTTTEPTGPPESLWVPKPTDVWQWDLDGEASIEPMPCYPGDGSLIADCPLDNRTEPNWIDFDPLNAQQGNCAAGQAGASCDEALATQAVADYHALGMHVVCYVDVGTAEDWRLDVGNGNFDVLDTDLEADGLTPSDLLGNDNGWAGEEWLNTNPTGPAYAFLQDMMTERLELAKQAGCDAIEPDNLDVSENSGTGVTETVAQGDVYAEWVANRVHSLGMSVAQKNFEDQSSVLEPYFDFVIEEQCYQYQDCQDLEPYITAGKAVFDVEYPSGTISSADCPAKNLVTGVDVMLKGLNVDPSPRVVCS
jgi:hypothetical protein